MATYPLSEAIAAGQSGHAALHNEERDAINDMNDRVDAGPFGFPFTHDPEYLRNDANSVVSANRGIYQRVIGGGTITKIGLSVGTQSGNISVAVYRNSGVGRSAVPGTRAVTTGAIACPGTGYQEVALGSSVDVNPGDWFFLSADNTTATFGALLNAPGDNNLGKGRAYRQDAAHPAPSTVGTLVAVYGYNYCLVGVE